MDSREVKLLNLSQIYVDPNRAEASDTRILEVEDVDLLPPIKVEQIGEKFCILNGHHRYRTAIKQGKTRMRAIIIKIPENIAR